ncbi:MAG: histidine kinase [Sphingobium sp.]|uniref:PAS domain S-box protein n=1 Tax=Sphingobium sp. TaxID=1912891 RepID=UPI000DB04CC9|nr:PAS domain S-box protein [Sphingobium sp.]PZU12642.1 MAG: histidine kinase [Sphingobium sp.]
MATGDIVQTAFVSSGDIGRLIMAKDWSGTSLGPIDGWPVELRAGVQTILSSPVPMVLLWGAEGLLIYNEGYAAVCGPRHPDALGGKLLDVWPEARDFNARVIAAGLAGEALSFHAQELELWRQGRPEKVWMDLEYSPIRDAHGTPVGMLAMVFDITDRIVAERRLAESEALFRFLDQLERAVAGVHDADALLAITTRTVATHLGVSSCAYADMDDDGDGFTVRGGWQEQGMPSILGRYRLGDFGTRTVEKLSAGRPLIVHDTYGEMAAKEAAAFEAMGIAATICMPLVKGGRLRALMAVHHKGPHLWNDYALAITREVAERSWAHVERAASEVNLRASEERLRLAVEVGEIGLWDIDMVANTLYWQPRVKAMFGISADAPITMADFYGGLHPEDAHDITQAFLAACDPDQRAFYDVEYRTVGKEDGVVRWVAAKGRGVFDDNRCLRVIGTAIDISRRKSTEQALRDLNETLERRITDGVAERKLLADVVENATAIIFVADPAFRWLAITKAASAAFEAIYGVRPAIGVSMLDALAHLPEQRAQIERIWARALAGEEFTMVEEFGDPGRLRRFHEITFNVLRNSAGERIGAYQIVHDVTERIAEQRRLAETEEQLRQTQKVEALGQLTGGVAHDFNNLLTPIIGTFDLLTRRNIGSDREKRLIDAALQSAERARTLVQRLLAFARRQPLQPTAVDIHELVTGMSALVASTTGPQVRVAMDVAADLPAARGDFNQLEMALLNLSVNARDAMPDGGTLSIGAVPDSIGPGGSGDLKEGAYVRITVADTGIGMDAETVARSIEPFFSTKGVGKGTGLGLSMVHGLARQLGGAMEIESRPGQGTRVHIWLPAVQRSASTVTPSGGAAPVPTPRRGMVLLVDDEEAVRASIAHMLEEAGFSVTDVGSAEEALAILRQDQPIALLVTDHLMPGMNGTQLVRMARNFRPTLSCLIVSGYSEVESIAPDLARLTKPFRAAELTEALGRLGV